MKLVSTLPERPGFLHVLPVLDLFALLLLFFLLGPGLLSQSGVAVDLPPSRFQMERFEEELVITLGPGDASPQLYLGSDPVTRQGLAARLDQLRDAGLPAKAIVLLHTDAGTPVGVERSITELILSKGFKVALVGRAEAPPEELAEDPEDGE
jgi:biopolymer transport protein ExbD